jgi:hypothetical protein
MTRQPEASLASGPTGAAPVPAADFRPGAMLALLLLCVYGGLALSVDFPRAALGIQSDEATYYMMGYSLALDGDLTYRREDLVRVWREFPSGPSGVFLKKGRDVTDWGFMRRPPFVWTTSVPDPDPSRYYYGKSFIYAAFAAPFVRLLGTNGFLVFHAVLLALVAWCGYVFLLARMRAAAGAILTGSFLLASVVPVYFVWIAPELFNFAVGFLAYFCWLYTLVATREQAPWGMRWLFGGANDLAASVLLGIVTFSKVTNASLFPPILAWMLWRREWRRAIVSTIAFAAVAGGLFAINIAISGEWNYQGGEDRASFYNEYPLQTPESRFEKIGVTKERNEALTEIIFDRRVFVTNLVHNLGYFVAGRYTGLLPYFFPALFALIAFVLGFRRRPAWQYFVVAAALAQMLTFIVGTPYTWHGGGGSVGNRYFMNAYGLTLFVMPVVPRLWLAFVPWIVGVLFTAPLVLNPFYASFYPGSYAKHGPLRWLPVELTLVYDWPINTDTSRVRVWFGDHPPEHKDLGFQIYFFDDNAYLPEGDKSFWVKGESRAEFLIKTDKPISRAVLTLTAGVVPTDVVVTVGRRTQQVSLAAGEQQRVFFSLDPGFLYQGTWPVWTASVSSSRGFVPIFHETGSSDTRYLGVRVDPMLIQ